MVGKFEVGVPWFEAGRIVFLQFVQQAQEHIEGSNSCF